MKFIKNKIVTVSSSSRFNYGDVLYPFIAEKMFNNIESHVNLMGVGLFGSNVFFDKFNPRKQYDCVVYLGGEMFPKSIIKHYKSESKFNYYFSRLMNKINPNDEGFFVKSKKKLSFGIGFQNLNENNESTIQFLKEFDFLGVRDEKSYENACLLGIKAEIVNDFAFLVSKVYPIKKEKVRKIVFHFNEHTLNEYFYNAITIILHYSKLLDCDFEIINMATCPNHDSIKMSQKLCDHFDKKFKLYEDVESITSLLATSKYYIGNSFHGGVVNLSYGGEIIWLSAHNKKIENLANNYMQTYIDVAFPDLSKTPSQIDPTMVDMTFEKIYSISQIFQ